MSAGITTHARQDFEFHLHLTMGEAIVLSQLFAYGGDALLKKSLELGSAVSEHVTDPASIMDSLYGKVRGPLRSEWERCMLMRRVFHNPDKYTIQLKEGVR
jgi:hypothetical protein